MPKTKPTKTKPKPVDPARPLTAQQAADRLGVSRSMVYKLANTGQLPGYRVGEAWRFLPSVVEAMMRAGTPSPVTPPAPTPAAEITLLPAAWRSPPLVDLMTIKEAAARLGCTPAEVVRLVEAGKLPERRAGGTLVFEPADIETTRADQSRPERRSA